MSALWKGQTFRHVSVSCAAEITQDTDYTLFKINNSWTRLPLRHLTRPASSKHIDYKFIKSKNIISDILERSGHCQFPFFSLFRVRRPNQNAPV